MTHKKTAVKANLTFSIEGLDEFEDALAEVNICAENFRASAEKLQGSIDTLNAIEIKIISEQS